MMKGVPVNYIKIAILDTSCARDIKWASNGNDAKEVNASPRLLELLGEGYTVYIASTRTKMFPETYDKCLFDLIPEERFFTAAPEMDTGGAQAVGLIDLWERVLAHFNIEIPEDTSEWGRSWMDLRYIARDAGITVR